MSEHHPTRAEITDRSPRALKDAAIKRAEQIRGKRQKVLSFLTRVAIENPGHMTTPDEVLKVIGDQQVTELFGTERGAEVVADEINRRMFVLNQDHYAPRHSDAQIRAGLSLDTPALELA